MGMPPWQRSQREREQCRKRGAQPGSTAGKWGSGGMERCQRWRNHSHWCNNNREEDLLGFSLWEPYGSSTVGIVHLLMLNLTPKWGRERTWVMVTWGIRSFSPEKDVPKARRVRNCRSCPKAHLILITTSLQSQSNLCPQPAALLLTNPYWIHLKKGREREGELPG